ncbi:MAG: DUF86 domain-containing protein [Candidatus Methanoperedens sp.]|nr:DUF86 domain-containing protein [Candidatus Methanoperedens sp.]
MKREFIDYLNDIFTAIEKVERFTQGMDLEEFVEDEKTVFAVVRALEIIGEAAKKIPVQVRDRYQDVPWQEMAGIRDKLIHEYFGVKLEVVWNTVEKDLPELKIFIAEMIEDTKREGTKKVVEP